MKTTIYYFTGTGNSLAVAKKLKAHLDDSGLVPVIQYNKGLMKSNKSKIIGLVFPVHGFTIPIPIREFLKKFDFSHCDYIFAIATRGGSPCRVFKHIDNHLKKQGKKLSAQFFIDMPNTWLLFWDPPGDEELIRINSEMEKDITKISSIIGNKDVSLKTDHGFFLLEYVLFPFLSFINRVTRYFWLDTAFYADENCVGCGQCAELCPADKIQMVNKKPVWKKEKKCTFCFGCIHYCPKQAIQLNATQSRKRGRYHHPDIGFKEIAHQK